MKYSRLVWSALALWAIAGVTTLAFACDQHKDASAASASNPLMLTAQGGHCSAAQAAACKVAGASAASMEHCAKGANASAASMDHCAKGANASTAAMEHCARGANASAAAMEHCARGANASAAAMEHCAKGASAAAASAALPDCGGQGMTRVAAMSGHADCDACKDMAACEQEILAAGGRSQIVPLKNGVMYVYTAGTAAGIRAVQAAVTHRGERMAAISSAADKTHLCSDCKAMRGAIASGKLNREVVSIEGGCLTLVTSNDPAIVARLHAMAGAHENHTKS